MNLQLVLQSIQTLTMNYVSDPNVNMDDCKFSISEDVSLSAEFKDMVVELNKKLSNAIPACGWIVYYCDVCFINHPDFPIHVCIAKNHGAQSTVLNKNQPVIEDRNYERFIANVIHKINVSLQTSEQFSYDLSDDVVNFIIWEEFYKTRVPGLFINGEPLVSSELNATWFNSPKVSYGRDTHVNNTYFPNIAGGSENSGFNKLVYEYLGSLITEVSFTKPDGFLDDRSTNELDQWTSHGKTTNDDVMPRVGLTTGKINNLVDYIFVYHALDKIVS